MNDEGGKGVGYGNRRDWENYWNVYNLMAQSEAEELQNFSYPGRETLNL